MTVLVTNRLERIRFYKFMAVGAFGAAVDFGVMNILTHKLSASLSLAGSVSFICAVISNFLWNRYWTYPDSRSRPIASQLMMFFIVNIAGILIRYPILNYLEEPLQAALIKYKPFVVGPDFLARNITLGVAVLAVMFWNFFANRYWTYNDIGKVK